MKAKVILSLTGLAGAAVLAGQMKAVAFPDRHGSQVSDGASLQVVPPAEYGLPGECGGAAAPSSGPDLVVCRVGGSTGSDMGEYGAVGGVSGYAFGTTSCNNGDTILFWIDTGANDEDHPVIGMNLYRLLDGRFEQIGLSWLKHGFCAADSSVCGSCGGDGNCDTLQIGCADTYGSFLNGSSGSLGPRSDVNPTTGAFSFPHVTPVGPGFGRILVDNDDLDPALNPGATYYGEAQYITPDDAESANGNNNSTWRQVVVGTFGGGTYPLSMTGPVVQQEPAIFAWQDPGAGGNINSLDVPEASSGAKKGRYYLAWDVTDNGDGTWHYEYALYNMNSHESARHFEVPFASGVTISNVDFHDVAYHSGDGFPVGSGTNYDAADWPSAIGATSVGWTTATLAADPNANALRWGTTYNFRFDANSPPTAGSATMGLYRTDSTTLSIPTEVPSDQVVLDPCPWDCDGSDDGIVGVDDFLAVLAQWTMIGSSCDMGLGDPGVGVDEFLDVTANWGPCP